MPFSYSGYHPQTVTEVKHRPLRMALGYRTKAIEEISQMLELITCPVIINGVDDQFHGNGITNGREKNA